MGPGEFDLVGFAVGVVERSRVLPAGVRAGDRIVGIASPGLRCNGYALARRALLDRAGRSLDDAGVARRAAHARRRAAAAERDLRARDARARASRSPVHAFAHITGGGLPDNLARVLPDDCDAVVHRGTWPEPRIFAEIQAAGDVADDEMEHVFNLGVGMVAVVAAADAQRAIDALAPPATTRS